MPTAPLLINGEWKNSESSDSFSAFNPTTGESLPIRFPTSSWKEIDLALSAAARASEALIDIPASKLADFLDAYASAIEAKIPALAGIGSQETGLPVKPRLADVELPRTVLQIRQAATHARDGSWAMPTIDVKANIRSMHGPLGPVVVFGPNNFPFAYNGIAGGDFAAAIAAGNPVIAKAHPLHPETTRQLAELALAALKQTGLPLGTVQMLYAMSNDDGVKMVSDSRVAAIGFTGSRAGGLRLKKACDEAGKLSYLEMSSINPVVILPGALADRAAQVVEQFVTSATMAAGQFCTNPGLLLMLDDERSKQFIADVKTRFEAATPVTMLSRGGVESLAKSVDALKKSGAEVVAGAKPIEGPRAAYANTLLRVSADAFLSKPDELQREAFGSASLVVLCRDVNQLLEVVAHLEGNLTGGIYSGSNDDDAYAKIERKLRPRVGRLLNDKMPTGVAVTAAMQHGGPYPATGHPGFTAVGAPATLRRFTQLQSYDNVREDRLPSLLRNANPTGKTWRLIDGHWSQGAVTA